MMHPVVEQEQTTSISKSPTMTIKQPTSGAVPLPTRMVLSAFAGMGAVVFCHPPLDVVRVQMQTFHYRNTAHAAVSIYKNAGFADGFYAGVSAAFCANGCMAVVAWEFYFY
jgi:hypothetical protein